MCESVQGWLDKQWSPEQIGQVLRRTFPDHRRSLGPHIQAQLLALLGIH